MWLLYNGWCVDWKGGKAKGKCSKMEVMPLSRRDRSDHFQQRTRNSEIFSSQNFCQAQSVQGLRDPKRTHSNRRVHSPRLQKTSTDHKCTCQRLLRNGSTEKGSGNQPWLYKLSQLNAVYDIQLIKMSSSGIRVMFYYLISKHSSTHLEHGRL